MPGLSEEVNPYESSKLPLPSRAFKGMLWTLVAIGCFALGVMLGYEIALHQFYSSVRVFDKYGHQLN